MHATRLRLPFVCLLLILAAPVLSAPSARPAGENASIPFASHGGIRDWEADGTQGLWVQGRDGSWYYGKFTFPCTGLPFKIGLQFKFGPSGELDRWGEVHTREAGRCLFQSFVTSAGPPKVKKTDKSMLPATPAAESAPPGAAPTPPVRQAPPAPTH